MAASSETQHVEVVSTHPLLNRFLLLAVLWLAMAAVAAMAVDSQAPLESAPAHKIIK